LFGPECTSYFVVDMQPGVGFKFPDSYTRKCDIIYYQLLVKSKLKLLIKRTEKRKECVIIAAKLE